MKVTVDIDETQFGLLCAPQDVASLLKSLSVLYGLIWTEAIYDPYNEHTRTYAKTLLPHIQHANEILKFKK